MVAAEQAPLALRFLKKPEKRTPGIEPGKSRAAADRSTTVPRAHQFLTENNYLKLWINHSTTSATKNPLTSKISSSSTG